MQRRQLETFIAIVDGGTLSAAAVALFKTQGAVSQDLKGLEAGIGIQLVDRTGQRVTLTRAGQALLPIARRLVTEFKDAEREMKRIGAGEWPVIRVACLPSVARTVGLQMARFDGPDAGLRWALTTSLRGEIVDGLRSGRYDLGICEARSDGDLTHMPLQREALRVVVPNGHVLASRAVVSPTDLAGLPYVGLDRSLGAAGEADRFFAAGKSSHTPVVQVNEAALVLDLVQQFDAFGIVPVSALSSSRGVTAIATDPPMTRQISLLLSHERVLSSAAASFAQHLLAGWLPS